MPYKKVLVVASLLMLLLGVDSCGTLPVISPTPAITTKFNTPTPTWTLTPTKSLTMTPTPVPPTYTPIPTLSMDLAYARFEELLQTNGNCELPCWWGIIPGKASFLDAQNTITPFSNIAIHNKFLVRSNVNAGAFIIAYPTKANNLLMSFNLSTLPDKNEIAIFRLSSQVLHSTSTGSEQVYDDQKYLALMKKYFLPSILSTNGRPDQVILYMGIIVENNDLPAYLDMRLLYPEKGIFVNYRMDAKLNGDQVITCPAQSFISLWLIPPSNDTSYQQALTSLSTDWDGYFPDISGHTSLHTLDEAAHISIDSFYAGYREPTNSCLVTPRSIWPRP